MVQTQHINMILNADTEYINKKMNEKGSNSGRARGVDELITTQEMSRILEMTNVNTTIVQQPPMNVQG